MHFFSKRFDSLNELFVEQLKDIYDCETRLVDALPKMVEAATAAELKQAFSHHLEQTREHCRKVETIFRSLNLEPERETCEGIKGLIAEGDEMIDAKGDALTRDAALIAAGQKVEHYEIATYGTLRTWAEELGMVDCERVLQSILAEEEIADETLSEIAQSRVNAMARH